MAGWPRSSCFRSWGTTRVAEQDAQVHRQAERDGAHDRLGAAARAQPDAQWLLRPRHDERVPEAALPVRSAPGEALMPVELQQQLELGAVEHVVVALVEVE